MHLSYTVTKQTTLFEILKKELHMSDRLIIKLKKNSKIFVNSNTVYKNLSLNLNDYIDIYIDFIEDNSNIVPTKMNLDILFEDDSFIIVNKVANMPVHPSMSHYENTLSNGIRYYFDEIGIKKKIRPVNRLDKDTSGIVIFAKNEYIQECLVKQMALHLFEKEYFAIVEGMPQKPYDTITAPIARKSNSIIEREVNYTNGNSAITHYKLIQHWNNLSLLNIKLETGRTHQIRVHLAYIGCPIVSDTLYGTNSKLINRQALHASKISFIHPITKQKMSIITELPKDMKQILNCQVL